MNRYRTLFDTLGVSPNASDAEVQQAWANRLADAGGLDNIEIDIEQAYRFLEAPQRRAEYRELLRACQDHHPLSVPEDNLEAFKQMCQKAKVSVWPDPKVPNEYVVRLPGQGPPRWHEPHEPIPPETAWELLVHFVKSVLLLGVFRSKTLGQRVGLVFAYLAFVVAAVFGLQWAKPRIDQWRARALEAAIRQQHAEAAAEFEKLKTADANLRNDFQAVTRAPVAKEVSGPRSREVDLALVRHQSVREAWAEIANGALAQTEFQKAEQTLSEVAAHIQAAQFGQADKLRLKDLRGWVRQKSDSLQVQRNNVEHIRTMLEADRFEEALNNPQKEDP